MPMISINKNDIALFVFTLRQEESLIHPVHHLIKAIIRLIIIYSNRFYLIVMDYHYHAHSVDSCSGSMLCSSLRSLMNERVDTY